jgi:hypothetical protein
VSPEWGSQPSARGLLSAGRRKLAKEDALMMSTASTTLICSFYYTAATSEEHQSSIKNTNDVAKVLYRHLFSDEMPRDILCAMMKNKQLKTLLIVDAFDEGSEDNLLLDRIIEGQLLRNCTVLLTSRPNHLKEKQNYFQPNYWVQGLTKEQQIDFLCKHLDNKFINDVEELKGLEQVVQLVTANPEGWPEEVFQLLKKLTQQKADPWKQIKREH